MPRVTHAFTGETINPTQLKIADVRKICYWLFEDLAAAKKEIEQMDKDYPFIPENYGFVKLDESNNEIVAYKKDNVFISRPYDSEHWFLSMYMSKDKNSVIKLSINTDRDAKGLFNCLGLVSSEPMVDPNQLELALTERQVHDGC